MESGLEGFYLHCLEGGLQHQLAEQFNSLALEAWLEGQCELCEFPRDIDIQSASKRLNKLFDLALGVLGSAGECAVCHKVGD